mgnify:FL=1
MKVVLIGPFPPLRGGISMFNHSLSNEFEKNHEVFRISFSLQYPKFLFPGKSQYSEFAGKPAEKLVNSINPLTWSKTAKRIDDIKPDLIIFQYWHPFFSLAYSSIAKKIKKSLKTKIIINCNNINPHEPNFFDKHLTKKFFKYGDYFVTMSQTVKKALLQIDPHAKFIESKHPIYDIFGDPIKKDIARQNLSLSKEFNEKIILYFGLIREYKGLDILIKAAQELKKKISNFKIVVAGECYGKEAKYLTLAKKLNVKDCFDFRFQFVKDQHVSSYFCSSDVVVLPYRSATQSGVIPIAYHFNIPVITTNVGGLPENVLDGQTGFICNPTPNELSKSIVKFFSSSHGFSSSVMDFKKQFSWEIFVKNIIEGSSEK